METSNIVLIVTYGLVLVGIVAAVFIVGILISKPNGEDVERGAGKDDDNIGTAA